MAINGNLYDWESMEIQLPSGGAVGITEISYSDERPVEPRHGKGGKSRGYGRKNYKASGSMTLDRDEAERLRKSLGGSFYKGQPFVINVSYGNEGQQTVTDKLPDVMITKSDTSGKQDEDNAGIMKLDFVVLSPIEWDGTPAY